MLTVWGRIAVGAESVAERIAHEIGTKWNLGEVRLAVAATSRRRFLVQEKTRLVLLARNCVTNARTPRINGEKVKLMFTFTIPWRRCEDYINLSRVVSTINRKTRSSVYSPPAGSVRRANNTLFDQKSHAKLSEKFNCVVADKI